MTLGPGFCAISKDLRSAGINTESLARDLPVRRGDQGAGGGLLEILNSPS